MAVSKRKRLTAKGVENAKAAAPSASGRRDGRRFIMDTDVSGFGIKVTETGSRSYVLIKRYPGFKHPTPRDLGKCDALTLEEAREKAREWLKLIARGIDPTAHEQQELARAASQRANTFGAVAEDFFREKVAHERQGKSVERDMRKEFVTPWKVRPVTELTEEDVLTVILAVKRRGTLTQARNLLGYIRRFFDWAIDQRVYGLKSNPCLALKPARLIGQKKSRDRILTDDEIFAFWRAAMRTPYPFGPVYRLLLLTGLRLNEVADARWREFDSRNAIWVIPAERMKGEDGAAREHVVPVTDDIFAVLKSLPVLSEGDYLFSTTFGASPVWMSGKVKARLDKRMLRCLKALARMRGDDPSMVELVPFVNHDLRRTLRTGLSALRVDRDVREAVLAHKLKGVEGVYDRYDFLEEKRDALTRWSNRVWQIADPMPVQNNVVSIQMRA